jgi:hypothetical protein
VIHIREAAGHSSRRSFKLHEKNSSTRFLSSEKFEKHISARNLYLEKIYILEFKKQKKQETEIVELDYRTKSAPPVVTLHHKKEVTLQCRKDKKEEKDKKYHQLICCTTKKNLTTKRVAGKEK